MEPCTLAAAMESNHSRMHLQSVDSRAHVHKHVAINDHFASLRRTSRTSNKQYTN